MTQSAQEIFTMQLARAAAETAERFLQMRGLQPADRDDIISAALAWCWENRANASLTTTLETWFMNAVRNAWRTWSRKELPTAAESLDNMGGGDDTYDIAAAESSAAAIVRELSPIERRVASLTMQGYTKKEMMDMGMSLRQINDSRASVKRLRSLLPDASNYSVLIRTPAAKSSDGDDDDNDDDTVRDMSPTSWIDNAFATLDFPPQHGSDCPPCWRCMWFEGFMPTGRRETRMKIEDAEVREAVKNTEARKIEIAQKVRDGIL